MLVKLTTVGEMSKKLCTTKVHHKTLKAQQFSSRGNPTVNQKYRKTLILTDTSRCNEAQLRSACRCELKELNRKCCFHALQKKGSAFNGLMCDDKDS